MKDYYQLLNIDRTASTEEISKAYRQQLRLWRSRTNAPDLDRRQEAERVLQELDTAKKILLDRTSRAEYDRLLPPLNINTETNNTSTTESTPTPVETSTPIVNRNLAALERRYSLNPTDPNLKLELAWEYQNSTCQNWTYVPADRLFFATEKSHIEEAQLYVNKAEALNCADPRLAGEIRETKNSIARSLQRQFTGNHIVAIAGGFLFTGFFELGIFLIPAYYIAYRPPQYVINRQVILGDRTWEQKFLQTNKTGLLAILAVVLMPPVYLVMIVSAYLRNYSVAIPKFGKLSFKKYTDPIKQRLLKIKQKVDSFL